MFGTTFEISTDDCVTPADRPDLGIEVDKSIFEQPPSIDRSGYVLKF